MRRLSCILLVGAAVAASCSGGAPTVTAAPTSLAERMSPSPTALPSATREPTATPTPTPTPTLTPTVGPTPLGGAVGLVFSVVQTDLGERLSQGVYYLAGDGSDLQLRIETGYRVLGVSPDGQRILVSHDQDLLTMRLDASESVLLASNLDPKAENSAYWHWPTDRIVFLGIAEDGRAAYVVDPQGGALFRLTPSAMSAVELFPSLDPGRVYWATGDCLPAGTCTVLGAWWSSLDGTQHQALPDGAQDPAGSALGTHFAYTTTDARGSSRIYIAAVDGSDSRRVIVSGDRFVSYAWSPDGTQLAMVAVDRSTYSGRILGYHFYVVAHGGEEVAELPPRLGPAHSLAWSPDGRLLAFTGVELGDQGVTIVLKSYDSGVRQVTAMDAWPEFVQPTYAFIPRLFWVP